MLSSMLFHKVSLKLALLPSGGYDIVLNPNHTFSSKEWVFMLLLTLTLRDFSRRFYPKATYNKHIRQKKEKQLCVDLVQYGCS